MQKDKKHKERFIYRFRNTGNDFLSHYHNQDGFLLSLATQNRAFSH